MIYIDHIIATFFVLFLRLNDLKLQVLDWDLIWNFPVLTWDLTRDVQISFTWDLHNNDFVPHLYPIVYYFLS